MMPSYEVLCRCKSDLVTYVGRSAGADDVMQHCDGAHADSSFCMYHILHNIKRLAKIRGRDNTQRDLQPRVSLFIRLHLPQHHGVDLKLNRQRCAQNIGCFALAAVQTRKAKESKRRNMCTLNIPLKRE